MRPGSLLTALAVAAGSAAAVAFGAAPAGAATAPAGTYVSFARPSRVVDVRLGAGHHVHPRIAGHGGLPAHGIGAVVGTLTAYSPTARRPTRRLPGASTGDGQPVLQPGRRRPATPSSSRSTAAGSTSPTSATAGHVRVALDVTGYYRSGSSSTPGAFHPSAARRGSSHGRNARRHGHAFTATIAGRHGVPKTSVGAVAVTIHVVSPTGSGTLLAGSPDAPQPTRPAVHFRSGTAASAFAIVPLGSGSGIRLTNAAHAGTVQVIVDVVGYFTYGTAEQAGEYEPLPSSALGWHGSVGGGRHQVGPGHRARRRPPHGRSPPRSVALHASGSRGSLQVVAGRQQPAARARGAHLRRRRHRRRTPSSCHSRAGGRFDLHSTSHQHADVAVDVVGYVPATTIRARPDVRRVATSATSSAHDNAGNVATMHSEGEQDAAAGSSSCCWISARSSTTAAACC